MSGYAGPDDESLHAIIMNENAIQRSQALLEGPAEAECRDCGEPIPKARRDALAAMKIKCIYCISCQESHDDAPHVKMLDRIL